MQTLIVERSRSGIVTVTLNRPKRKNAINALMFEELRTVFGEVGTSPDDRVLVLTGVGDAFSSGADLKEFGGGVSYPHPVQFVRSVGEVCLALHQIPKPTIAKVNGLATGAGLNLALGCDLIVASDRARLCEIFARRGLSVDFGGSWVLPRLVGLHRAKELVLLADWVSAEEAERMGLVNRVVPHEELDAFVADWADRLAAGPPLALSMSKRLLSQGLDISLPEALEAEAVVQGVNATTRDGLEAIQAFAEKRTPTFEGR
jgi:2-(1,2-epoxy-1,2-dihydrophenyl)acetyl-CoA isomerase